MSVRLQATVSQLSEALAAAIVDAVRSMSLDELAHLSSVSRPRPAGAPKRKVRTPQKRVRRSAKQLETMSAKIVALVRHEKKGINAEAIRKTLNVPRSVLPKPLALALKSKKIRKRGQKRATMYYGA